MMTGHFLFSEHDTVKLAQKYKTPLYVLSQDKIIENINALKEAFKKTGIKYEISYAGKAFLDLAIARLMQKEGLGLDCVSGGVLFTALQAGFDPKRITFHGSNKSEQELREALEAGVGRIVVDSLSELKMLDRIAKQMKKKADILVRINPGVDAHTHEFINTGKTDSKFGIPLDQTTNFFKQVEHMDNLRLIGLHSHIGSQITEEKPFLAASRKMLRLYKYLKRRFKDLNILDLGGGFGINYKFGEKRFQPDVTIPKIVKGLKRICKQEHIKMPIIGIEPGRFIVGDAGITLYTVGTIKRISDDRIYLSIDGGMNDNPRPALYGAEYEAIICNRPLTKRNQVKVRVSGRTCEADTIIDTIPLAEPQEGDILAILKTGAYNYSMSSNYNRYPRPAVVLLNGGEDCLIAERESYQDLIRQDKLPVWL